jgi:hypothetical protein
MPSNNDQRGVSQMELEVEVLDLIMDSLHSDDVMSPASTATIQVVDRVGGLTARLINRGHPAGYVVTDKGTYMVVVEKVSNATVGVKDERGTTTSQTD